MELRNGEKLILVMLSEIYQKLEIVGEIDPQIVKTLIMRDAPWALAIKYGGILHSEAKPAVVEEVFDILDMWMAIQNGYEDLAGDEKAKIDQSKIRFPGFDGNNEIDHLSAANTMVNYLDLYGSVKAQVVNSHSRTLHKHHRMLEVFKRIRSEQSAAGAYQLSSQQIQDLIKA